MSAQMQFFSTPFDGAPFADYHYITHVAHSLLPYGIRAQCGFLNVPHLIKHERIKEIRMLFQHQAYCVRASITTGDKSVAVMPGGWFD